jgi:hypothetical protein
MFGLTLFGWLVAFWAAVTAILLLTMMYRGLIGLHEENQVFLDPAEAAFESEQRAVAVKLTRINAYVHRLGTASGILLVTMAGWVIAGVAGKFP